MKNGKERSNSFCWCGAKNHPLPPHEPIYAYIFRTVLIWRRFWSNVCRGSLPFSISVRAFRASTTLSIILYNTYTFCAHAHGDHITNIILLPRNFGIIYIMFRQSSCALAAYKRRIITFGHRGNRRRPGGHNIVCFIHTSHCIIRTLHGFGVCRPGDGHRWRRIFLTSFLQWFRVFVVCDAPPAAARAPV